MAELFAKEAFLPETIQAAELYCNQILSWALNRQKSSKISSFKLSDCKQAFMTVNELQLRAACCMLARDGKLCWIEKARILTFEVVVNKAATKLETVVNVHQNNGNAPNNNNNTRKKRESKEMKDDIVEDDKENVHQAKKLKPATTVSAKPNPLSTIATVERKKNERKINMNKTTSHSVFEEVVPNNCCDAGDSVELSTTEFDLYEYEGTSKKKKECLGPESKESDIKVHFETREEKKAREDLHASFDRSHEVYMKVLDFVGCSAGEEFQLDSLILNIQEKNPGFSAQEVVDAMKRMEMFNKIMFIDDQSLIKI